MKRKAVTSARPAAPLKPRRSVREHAMPEEHERPAAGNRHAEDALLVGRCLRGDQPAWADLLTRHRPLIMTIARRHGIVGEAAEDLFQETCLVMLERLHLLRDHESLAAWIATTATRKCWRRRRQPVDAETAALADGRPSPQQAFEDATREEAVRRAVAALAEPCRTLLRALFAEDVPYDVLARRLGLSVGSIGVYRRRCLDRLRERLRADGWSFDPADLSR